MGNGSDHHDNAARALARLRPVAVGRPRTGRWSARRVTARVMWDGVLLYLQYFFPDTGKLPRVPLGPYDEAGTRGLSVVQARDRADRLAALYQRGAKELNAHLESSARPKKRLARARRNMLNARHANFFSMPTPLILIVTVSSLQVRNPQRVACVADVNAARCSVARSPRAKHLLSASVVFCQLRRYCYRAATGLESGKGSLV